MLNAKVAELDLSSIGARLLRRYHVSVEDVDVAIATVRAFLDAKQRDVERILILPQIADWAWHELILDTSLYQTICMSLFGACLPHVASDVEYDEKSFKDSMTADDYASLDPRVTLAHLRWDGKDLREEFLESIDYFERGYGIKLGDFGEQWLEAGWNSPAYRLRNPLSGTYSNFELTAEGRTAIAAHRAKRPSSIQSISLSWLAPRLVTRFEISRDAATLGVEQYLSALSKIADRAPSISLLSMPLAQVAWQEHRLWTHRYRNDCEAAFDAVLVSRADGAELVRPN